MQIPAQPSACGVALQQPRLRQVHVASFVRWRFSAFRSVFYASGNELPLKQKAPRNVQQLSIVMARWRFQGGGRVLLLLK